ncbi:MAG TPA: glycosyltransferase family 2 protein [Actinomycetota bacterium]|nr:glycosyltransferase family 2 protein [Actinomycetota bacterium]
MRDEPVLAKAPEAGRPTLTTIAIPTYNRLGLLERALASAMAQDYADLEIVISDNASTDGTEQFCRSVCEKDARVRYYRLPENVGHARNFAAAFRHVRGPFFLWLADDDWIDSNFVSRCVEKLQSHPDTVLVCGVCIYYREGNPSELNEPVVNLLSESPTRRVLDHYRSVKRNATLLGVTRSACIEADAFPTVFGGDWLLLARLAFQGKVNTLGDVALHRSLGGESGDMRGLAMGFGLSPAIARVPNVAITWYAVRDVLRADSYRRIGTVRRVALAGEVGGALAARFGVPYLVRRIPGAAAPLRRVRDRFRR